jgi:hypothetical protein
MMGCNMSPKIHFLHSHLDLFPENIGDASDECHRRFQWNISAVEECYLGKWDLTVVADYCWQIKREDLCTTIGNQVGKDFEQSGVHF